MNPLIDFRFRVLADLETECHVVVYGHVGIQGVILEHHCDIAVFGSYVVHQLSVDEQLTFRDLLEPGDHSEGRGFAASGRPDKYHEFLIVYGDIRFVNSENTAGIHLGQVFDLNSSH